MWTWKRGSLVLFLISASACGSSNTAPSTIDAGRPRTPAQTCRVYPTGLTVTGTIPTPLGTFSINETTTCSSYNSSANQLTRTTRLTAGGSGGSCTTTMVTVSSWASLADFIAEV